MLLSPKITAVQAYMMLMLSIGLSNHVLLIPILLETAHRDAWVGVLAAIVPQILWVLVIVTIHRKTAHGRLVDWLGQRYGIAVRIVVTTLVIVYITVAMTTTFLDTVTWTQTSYLPMTPTWAIALLFIPVCFFSAMAGIRTIAIASGVLLPFVVLLGYFVGIANFQVKDYSLLTPLFTHGYKPSMHAALYTCTAGFEMILVLFMQHHVSKSFRTKGMLLLMIVLIGLTFGPLTGSISIFGPFESAEQRYPAFEQWRMVSIGKFVSHLDFFSIYQWVAGTFVRVSLAMFLITDVLPFKKSGQRSLVLAVLAVVMMTAVLSPISDMSLFKTLKYMYFPGSLVIHLLLGLMLLILALIPYNRKKERTDE